MTLLAVLVIVYIVYFIISMINSRWILLAPSNIFFISMVAMLSLALLFADILGFEVHERTFWVFSIAGACYLLGDFVGKITTSPKEFYEEEVYNYGPFYITSRTKWGVNIFLFVSMLFAYYVLQINAGGDMEAFKDKLLYNPESVRYRVLVSQIYKINTALCYLIMYIFVYNIVVFKVPFKDQKSTIITIVLYSLFSTFAMGARQPTIEAIFFMAFVYVALKVGSGELKDIYKFAIKILPLSVLLVVGFSATAVLVGRRDHSDISAMQYFVSYFSGGLYAFDLHINEPCRSKIWGESSFADVHVFLNKIGLTSTNIDTSYHEFELYGNTVTIYGRWYEDFGAIGVYIMIFLVALFYAHFFYKYIKAENIYSNHMVRFFFCKFLIVLLLAGYDDRVRVFFTTMTIALFFIMPFLFYRFVHIEESLPENMEEE